MTHYKIMEYYTWLLLREKGLIVIIFSTYWTKSSPPSFYIVLSTNR